MVFEIEKIDDVPCAHVVQPAVSSTLLRRRTMIHAARQTTQQQLQHFDTSSDMRLDTCIGERHIYVRQSRRMKMPWEKTKANDTHNTYCIAGKGVGSAHACLPNIRQWQHGIASLSIIVCLKWFKIEYQKKDDFFFTWRNWAKDGGAAANSFNVKPGKNNNAITYANKINKTKHGFLNYWKKNLKSKIILYQVM